MTSRTWNPLLDGAARRVATRSRLLTWLQQRAAGWSAGHHRLGAFDLARSSLARERLQHAHSR